jgi:hypothetical protein
MRNWNHTESNVTSYIMCEINEQIWAENKYMHLWMLNHTTNGRRSTSQEPAKWTVMAKDT